MPTPTPTTSPVSSPALSASSTTSAVAPRARALYRALQVYAVLAPQLAYALTVYGLSHHLGVEAWPVSAWIFALPGGYLLDELLRLAITASVFGQSVYAWRLATRARGASARLTLATGWIGLGLWALIVTADGLWDASGFLLHLLH